MLMILRDMLRVVVSERDHYTEISSRRDLTTTTYLSSLKCAAIFSAFVTNSSMHATKGQGISFFTHWIIEYSVEVSKL